MDAAITALIDRGGLLGILLVLAILAVGVLYRTIQGLHEQGREDAKSLVTAMVESASAQRETLGVINEVRRALDQNTIFLQQALNRRVDN